MPDIDFNSSTLISSFVLQIRFKNLNILILKANNCSLEIMAMVLVEKKLQKWTLNLTQ